MLPTSQCWDHVRQCLEICEVPSPSPGKIALTVELQKFRRHFKIWSLSCFLTCTSLCPFPVHLLSKIPPKADGYFQWDHSNGQCCYKRLLRLSRFDAFQWWELWRIPTSLGLVHEVLKSLTKTFLTTLLLIITDEQLPDHWVVQNPKESIFPLVSILLIRMPRYFFFHVTFPSDQLYM